MTAEEFFNNQSPTDANNCVVDVFARKFSREDLLRFAEAYCNVRLKEKVDKTIGSPLTYSEIEALIKMFQNELEVVKARNKSTTQNK